MPREKSTSRRFNVTAASLDAFVTQLCFLRRFRGKMNRSPIYTSNEVENPALKFNSPISSYFLRGGASNESKNNTSTPSSKHLQQLLRLDLSPILDSDESVTSAPDRSSKCHDIPPSPPSYTPRSSGRPVTRIRSPRSENESTSLRTPGRDGDGAFLLMLEAEKMAGLRSLQTNNQPQFNFKDK